MRLRAQLFLELCQPVLKHFDFAFYLLKVSMSFALH